MKTISTDKAPAAIGPYSQAKVAEKDEICTQREDITNESLQHGEGCERKLTFLEVIGKIREKAKDSSQMEKRVLFGELS